MRETFVADIEIDSTQDRALKMLCHPTTAHRMFGAEAAATPDISLIVPDNEILGSVLARKIRRMPRKPGESAALTSNFCQAPEPRRFSIVAYQKDNVLDVAGFATINWTLDRDVDVDGPGSDADPGDFTLCVDLESLFIHPGHRGQGYARALMHANCFWFENMIVEIDSKAARRDHPINMSIILTADASSTFGPDIVRSFVDTVETGLRRLRAKRTMNGFSSIDISTDISWEGAQLSFA